MTEKNLDGCLTGPKHLRKAVRVHRLQIALMMLKPLLAILLTLSAQSVFAEKLSCMSYVLGYSFRTEETQVNRLEPWLSRLREFGLGELSALVEQKKITVRETAKTGGEPVVWRTKLRGSQGSRGYMLILNRGVIAEDTQAFWKFANALYEIYFYRSLWGLPPDFWDEGLSLSILTSRAPVYFESLARITRLMYGLYDHLEKSEKAKLPKRQLSEPGVLGQATRIWSAPVDNQLNERDLNTFKERGQAGLAEVLRNRLEPRVVIGHYAGYMRKFLLVTTTWSALMAAVHLPAQVHTIQMLAGPMLQQATTLNSSDKDKRYINNMRLSYKRELLRREELLAKPSLSIAEKQELNEVEAEIEAILDDVPELRNE